MLKEVSLTPYRGKWIAQYIENNRVIFANNKPSNPSKYYKSNFPIDLSAFDVPQIADEFFLESDDVKLLKAAILKWFPNIKIRFNY